MSRVALLDVTSGRDLLLREAGGKATRLADLESLGFQVPRWFCVPATAYDDAVEAWGRRSTGSGPPMPDEVAAAIRRELRGREMTRVPLAVRSSGLEEDGLSRSFAGQFESYLHCTGEEDVVSAVERCWASAFSERVRVYRATVGKDEGIPRMGVVIQEMVEATSAGVAFSRNPLRPLDREHAIVESVWGLGDGLVGGEAPADRFTVHRSSLDIVSDVAEKTHERVRGRSGGTRDHPLPGPRRSRPSLNPDQVAEVVRAAIRLEEELGVPQDLEWAYEDDRLLLLQTRPITTLPPQTLFDPSVVGDDAVVWDNSNIIESYAGVTTPLTFSHVSRSYREVYRVTCRMAGVPESVIDEHDHVFRNMLGLVRGRIYYNLANWYRLLSLFPLLGRSARFMETMMGVRASLPEELAERVDPTAAAPRYGVVKRVALLLRLLVTLVGGRRERRAFLRRMDDVCGPLEAADLTNASLPDQLAAHRALEERILRHWTAPINNDTRCMISFGLLAELTRRWIVDDEVEAASLQNDLLCGQGDLTSAEPTRILMEIAREVESRGGELRSRFVHGDAEEVWAELPVRAPGIRRRLDAYVRRFGFRCVDELKLETRDFHDRPHLLISTIAGYLECGVPSTEEMKARERRVREGAEARVRETLGVGKRWLYGWTLRWTRRAVADRERLRFERTRAFGLMRRIYRGAGRNLAALGHIEDEADVFYLTVEELLAFAEGRAVSLDLAAIVAARRDEYERYRRTPDPPDRFVTRGVVGASLPHHTLLLDADLRVDAVDADGSRLLRGTPCCAGVVEATVRVAHSFEECAGMSGEILVTRRTDPGWIPVFPSLAGLLVERGGLLSHSAVVAREMGVPTIVGLGGRPLERLRTGDRVRMDGAAGTVEVVS